VLTLLVNADISAVDTHLASVSSANDQTTELLSLRNVTSESTGPDSTCDEGTCVKSVVLVAVLNELDTMQLMLATVLAMQLVDPSADEVIPGNVETEAIDELSGVTKLTAVDDTVAWINLGRPAVVDVVLPVAGASVCNGILGLICIDSVLDSTLGADNLVASCLGIAVNRSAGRTVLTPAMLADVETNGTERG